MNACVRYVADVNWSTGAEPAQSSNTYIEERQLTSTLDSLDGAVNYRSWILDMIRPYLDGPILEIGAGHGTFTGQLAELGPVHAIEPGAESNARLVERFDGHADIEVTSAFVDELDPASKYGSAVMINVLEHIEDDDQALVEINQRLRPGGHLAIWVPAFSLLFSDFDRRLGHFRRYRRAPLLAKVEEAGFRVVNANYVNLPGWFSWLAVARILRRTPSSDGLVSVFDRVLVPPTRAIEQRVRVPFGQSILVIARRPLS